jgi:deferrochelatase/peroxidase EfeB
MTAGPPNASGGSGQAAQRRGRFPVSRRKFFGAVGGLAAGAAVIGADAERASSDAPQPGGMYQDGTESFYGVHQSGIITSPQSHTYFAALDVTTEYKRDVADLLQRWTNVAARLSTGRTAGPVTGDTDRIEPDSGEARGLGAARLTVNFGFGPTLFAKDGHDRFGLAHHQPYELAELPEFPGDQLTGSRTGGDLTIHACADDPQVAFHAVRQLARAADGIASIRWSQAGFNEAAASAGTPRNLMGFKDGTINPQSPAQLDQFVWVGYEGPDWMTGGTYLVIRRIRISLGHWDVQSLGTQEQVIGRYKMSGAPLGKSGEFDALDLGAKDGQGNPFIPVNSHVRLASPQENWGSMMLRRSYAYDDGMDISSEKGSPGQPPMFDAGLLFACYQRNPLLAFVAIFRKLAENDALSQFTTHTGSAIVAIPPAAAGPAEWVGQRLFET